VLLTNISAQLLPVTSSPEFVAHPSPSTPSSAQLYVISFACFTAELLESLDARGLFMSDHHAVFGVADSLRSTRDGLESLIRRVINPLATGIKTELLPLIEALEYNTPALISPSSQPKQGATHNKGGAVHPSIAALQNLIHAHARNVTQYMTPPTMTSQNTLGTLLISLIWHGLVALSNRAPMGGSSSVASVPTHQLTMSTTLRWMKVGGTTTPPMTPPSMRIKLPPSRPPSPPTAPPPCPAMDARTLYNLFNVLPRPNEDARYALAKEAVDEAFGSLAALCALLDFEAAGELGNLDGVTSDIPTVIALPVLLRIFGRDQDEKEIGSWNVPSLLDVSDKEYREACLGGFGRAEECGPMIARKVLDILMERRDAKNERFIHWLEGRASTAD
jgi:hypothetical protein